MSNSLVSFTKGALASRIVVGYRGIGSSPSLRPFEDAVDIRYRPAQHGHLPDRSNLPLPAAQLILEKCVRPKCGTTSDTSVTAVELYARAVGRETLKTHSPTKQGRLLSRAAVSEMTGVRVVHDPRPANEIARRGAMLDVHIAF